MKTRRCLVWGAAAVVALAGVLTLVVRAVTDEKTTASVTACNASGDRVHVEGTVNASGDGSVYIEWSYRDSQGNDLGWGNHWVRGIEDGETLDWTADGFLDRLPDGQLRCEITEADFHSR